MTTKVTWGSQVNWISWIAGQAGCIWGKHQISVNGGILLFILLRDFTLENDGIIAAFLEGKNQRILLGWNDFELVPKCGQPLCRQLIYLIVSPRIWSPISHLSDSISSSSSQMTAESIYIPLFPIPLNLQLHWLLLSISNPWSLFPHWWLLQHWQVYEVFGDIVVWGKLGEWGKCYRQNSVAFKSSLVPVHWGILWHSWEYFILTY